MPDLKHNDPDGRLRPAGEARASKSAPLWLFLPALGVAVFLIYPAQAAKLSGWQLFAVRVFLLLCLAGALGSVLRLPLSRVFAVLVVGGWWAAFFFVFGWALHSSIVGLLLFWPYWVPTLLLAVVHSIPLARMGSDWAGSAVFVGMFCGLLAIGSIFAERERRTTYVPTADPLPLGPVMARIVTCNQEYSAQHGTFVSTLADLGPSGSGCLPAPLVSSTYQGFGIIYLPDKDGISGRIPAYRIRAMELAPKSENFAALDADESGRVRYRFAGPRGGNLPMLYAPFRDSLEQLLGCLNAYAVDSNLRDAAGAARQCIANRLQNATWSGEHHLSLGGWDCDYRIEYATGGKPKGYSVSVRPVRYGIDGIRSLLITMSTDWPNHNAKTRAYGTPEDRPATANDPFAYTCELKYVACNWRASGER